MKHSIEQTLESAAGHTQAYGLNKCFVDYLLLFNLYLSRDSTP